MQGRKVFKKSWGWLGGGVVFGGISKDGEAVRKPQGLGYRQKPRAVKQTGGKSLVCGLSTV